MTSEIPTNLTRPLTILLATMAMGVMTGCRSQWPCDVDRCGPLDPYAQSDLAPAAVPPFLPANPNDPTPGAYAPPNPNGGYIPPSGLPPTLNSGPSNPVVTPQNPNLTPPNNPYGSLDPMGSGFTTGFGIN